MSTCPLLRGPLLGLGLSLALVACGDDPSGAGGSGGADGPGGGPTSTSIAGGGSGGGGATVDPSTLHDSGVILVDQFGQETAQVSASFQQGRPARVEERPDCEVREEGPCTVIRCGEAPPEDTEYLDAGTFDLTGTLVAVTPDRDERGRYTWEGEGRLFGPNATLEATFEGGDVAPFAVTLHAPPRITAVEPSFSDLVVMPGRDLAITWELEGTGGVVQVALVADRALGFDSLLCRFDADDLAASIPGHLFPTEGTPLGAYIATVVEEHVPVHTHDVTLHVMDMAELGAFSIADAP